MSELTVLPSVPVAISMLHSPCVHVSVRYVFEDELDYGDLYLPADLTEPHF